MYVGGEVLCCVMGREALSPYLYPQGRGDGKNAGKIDSCFVFVGIAEF